MTSALKLLALGVAISAVSVGCNRENEEEPLTPANATGQPRQVPDSRYDDKDPNGNPRAPHGPMSTPSEPYDPFNTPLDGSAPPSNPDPTNPGLSPTTPGTGPGTSGPGSSVP